MTRWLGPLLLIGVFARHNLTWLPGYSPAEWFYLLGGAWEIVLCAVLLLFVSAPLAMAALWIGILEGGQVAVCGALMGYARPPAGMNECDYLASLPIGATMIALYLYIVMRAIAKAWYDVFGFWHEIALGAATAIIVVIAGNEIAYLINPWAAILIMAAACLAGGFSYERPT